MILPDSILEGKFEVVRKLSEGGMGAVYLVRHLHLEQRQVIKVIRPQHAASEDLQMRFRREAQTAIRLRHPNIAEIYDFSVGADGTAYLVMEYIDGRTLEELLLKRGRLALGLTLEVAIQTLKALAFLHHRHFIHRDISPDNVMLTRDFDGEPLAKLIDLGIAKRIGDDATQALTQVGMFVGKARYSSPEHCGRGELGPHSDIYSFGVVLYELLTGASPIPGESIPELIGAHLLKPPIAFAETDPQGHVPQELRAIVMRSLEKDAERRVSSAEEFRALLEPLWQGMNRAQTTIDLEHTLHLPTGALTGRQTDPDRVSAALSSARLLVGQSKFDEARTELRQILEMDPQNTEAVRILSMVDELLKHRAEAERQGAITRQAEKIEKLLENGELDAAGTELADAVDEYGEAELFHQLHLRIEGAFTEEKEHQEKQQALALLAKAEHYQDGGDLEGTRRTLDEVRDLAVRDTEVEHRLAAVGEEVGRLAAEQARIEEERQQAAQRRQAFQERLDEARRQQAAGALEEARERLQEALALEPGNRRAELLLTEIEGALEKDRQEESRQREIQGEVQRIRRLIAGEQLEEAATTLGAAVQRLEAEAAWHELRDELEAAQRRQVETRIAKLLEEARFRRQAAELEPTLQADELEEAARRVEEALTLDRENREALELRDQIEADRREWKIAGEVGAMGACLEQGELEKANEMLVTAEREYGSHRSLRALRQQLVELVKVARVPELLEKASSAALADDLVTARRLVSEAQDIEPDNRQAAALRDDIEAAVRRTEARARERGLVAVAAEVEDLLARGKIGLAEKRRGQASELYGEEPVLQGLLERCEEARREEQQKWARRKRRVLSRVPWAVAAVVAIAIGLKFGLWLSSTSRQPPKAVAGTAIVNAVPWGRLVEILDESGQPVTAAPRGATTPVVVSLPPGRYSIRLENEHFTRPTALEIEVVEGEEKAEWATFEDVSVDEFLQDLGW